MAVTDYPRNYACCKCQARHYSGDPLFDQHTGHMSKHGFQHSDSYEPYRPVAFGDTHVVCEFCPGRKQSEPNSALYVTAHYSLPCCEFCRVHFHLAVQLVNAQEAK